MALLLDGVPVPTLVEIGTIFDDDGYFNALIVTDTGGTKSLTQANACQAAAQPGSFAGGGRISLCARPSASPTTHAPTT